MVGNSKDDKRDRGLKRAFSTEAFSTEMSLCQKIPEISRLKQDIAFLLGKPLRI